MGLFNRKKKEEHISEEERLDKSLRDDISKAYDELMSGGNAENEEQENKKPEVPAGDFEAELIKAKIRTFKEKKTNEALADVFNSIAGKKFFLPSVSNMKEPFERDGNKAKLKPGAVLNPALLTSKDKKTYLPIFTDEKSMTQKSPSGVVIQFTFDQCVGIVYNKKNPVTAIVINPFTENFIISEELLKAVFKKIEKND